MSGWDPTESEREWEKIGPEWSREGRFDRILDSGATRFGWVDNGRWSGVFGWSVSGVGVVSLLFFCAWATVARPSTTALAVQAALPVGISVLTIGLGVRLRRAHPKPNEIGHVAGIVLLGAAVFALLTGWIVYAFDVTASGTDLFILLLNGATVGMFPHKVLGVVYLRLQNRRRELAQQNARLERFTGTVSHDLRNPLGIAQGYLDVVTDGNDEGANAAYFEKIEAALERMDALIGDLLTLSKVGGRIEDGSACPLGSVSREAWGFVETDGVALDVDDGLPTVVGDRGLVSELFENLFRNAIEHGGEVETVTVGRLDDGSGFYVADDGVGVPADEREAVLEYGHTSSRNGTGFGLAIVADIADAHGWRLHVAENVGAGARFEFETGP